jgi:hypothetical protein
VKFVPIGASSGRKRGSSPLADFAIFAGVIRSSPKINPGTEVAGFNKTPTDWQRRRIPKEAATRASLLLFGGLLGLFLGRFFLGHALLFKIFRATARIIFNFSAR